MADLNQAVTLIDQLSELRQKISAGEDKAAINKALQLNKSLALSLNHPANAAVELAFSPLVSIAARIAIDLDLFKLIANHGPISSEALASHSGGEELLIIRVLRPLSSGGYIDEVDERQWSANPITRAMAKEEIAAGHRMLGEIVIGPAQKGPKYLREYGHRCPTDPRDGFAQYAFQTKLTLFGLLETMPEIARDFNIFMGHAMGSRNFWYDWFPVKEQLLEGLSTEPESVLLVDVGAGKGHDLVAFREKYPSPGKLVLQDLAAVTDTITDLDPCIEVMPYDFFNDQPVKGARAYFFHHIFHGWSNPNCLRILKHLKGAMKPGYSKLLINDMIIPEKGASPFHAMFDMTMMAGNAGMERTERQWRELLQSAGYTNVKIWRPLQEDGDGIVEATIEI